MVIQGFLKVPDIPGASAYRGHEDEIEVYGVTFSMEVPLDPNSLARRRRAALSMIMFKKHYDKASPYLKKALFDNTPFDEVVFSAQRTTEGVGSDYLVVTLTRASVAKYEMQPAEDEPELFEEHVGLTFQTIKFNYENAHEVELTVSPTK